MAIYPLFPPLPPRCVLAALLLIIIDLFDAHRVAITSSSCHNREIRKHCSRPSRMRHKVCYKYFQPAFISLATHASHTTTACVCVCVSTFNKCSCWFAALFARLSLCSSLSLILFSHPQLGNLISMCEKSQRKYADCSRDSHLAQRGQPV